MKKSHAKLLVSLQAASPCKIRDARAEFRSGSSSYSQSWCHVVAARLDGVNVVARLEPSTSPVGSAPLARTRRAATPARAFPSIVTIMALVPVALGRMTRGFLQGWAARVFVLSKPNGPCPAGLL